jgi:flagellar protein FlaG
MSMDKIAGAGSSRALQLDAPGRGPANVGAQASAARAARDEAKAAANRAASEEVRRAVADANRQLVQKGSELTFEFDEDAGRVIVRLVDTRTREVLRQIPSEEVIEIALALRDDAAAGALLRVDA